MNSATSGLEKRGAKRLYTVSPCLGRSVLRLLLFCSGCISVVFFGGGIKLSGFKGESNALYSTVQTHLASCGFDSRRIISIYYCIVFSVDETLYKSHT